MGSEMASKFDLEEQRLGNAPKTVATTQGKSIDAQPGATWGDLGAAGATGVRGGAESTVGAGGDIPALAGRGAAWLSGKTGIGDPGAAGVATEQAVKDVTSPMSGIVKVLQMMGIIAPKTADTATHVIAPSSADVASVTDPLVSSVSPALQEITRHQATTPEERFLETSGQMAGTAFLPGGPLAKLARPFIAGEGVELAGGAVPKEYEDVARLVAGLILGGGTRGVERSFRERSALRQVGSTPKAALRVKQLLQNQGMTPEEATARMKELGAEGTLLDVGPATAQEAGQIHSTPGPGRTTIDAMLRAREEGSNRRLMEDVGATVGPYRERAPELAALEDRLKEKGTEQTAAAKGGMPADPQSIVDELDAQMQGEKSNKIRSALMDVRDMMFVRDKDGNVTSQLDTTSSGLLKARQALKDMLYNDDGSKKTGDIVDVLKGYYGKINEALDPANPALRQVDKQIEAIAKEKEAFQTGEQVYEKGREAPGPVGFAETWNTMSAEERAAAVRGLGAETHRLLGQFGKDRVTLQKNMVGEGKWPSDKLETMIGPEKTRQLEAALAREKTFQERYQRIVQNSASAEKLTREGGGVVKPLIQAGVDVAAGAKMGGWPGAGGALLANMRRLGQDLMSSRGATSRDAQVAKMLTSQRPDEIAAALKIVQERGSVMPQAVITALLSRQQDVSGRKGQ
jgi:hypothetical protein